MQRFVTSHHIERNQTRGQGADGGRVELRQRQQATDRTIFRIVLRRPLRLVLRDDIVCGIFITGDLGDVLIGGTAMVRTP